MRATGVLLAIGAMVLFGAVHAAAATRIVALGASNTYGKGVARNEAYPAHLQRILRAKGVQATVVNAGINGNTTGQMLARLESAVPAGTNIVILQPGGNDRRKGEGGDSQGNVAAIQSRLSAKGIKVILLPNALLGQIRRQSPENDQGDGSHLTSRGYAALAASLMPEVLAAAGR
jgi:acyl-CoA thioesterase-1